ncbi:MAG: glycosyltransferase family 2 protein [Proteobacteria bacterium]|nr:glycosyltransferase family 2 protein [Pseudomonadota bacterium]
MIFTVLAGLSALISAPFILMIIVVIAASVIARIRKQKTIFLGNEQHRFVVVIPAHNEAANISDIVKSVLAADYDRNLFRVLVIADNCTDDTSAIARAQGAEVFERNNAILRGKGHALAEVIDEIILDADGWKPDAVIILDADSLIDPTLFLKFSRGLTSGYEWMQGYYNGSNPDASIKTGLMSIALAIFNGVWLAGTDALGLSVSLRGNGMCLSVSGLRRQRWRASGLAEDLEFSWVLRLAGERVRFIHDAKVFGELVSRNQEAAEIQRLRWEHGRKILRKLFRSKLLESNLSLGKKLAYLIDLYMPPISPLAIYVLLSAFTVVILSSIFGVKISGIKSILFFYGIEIASILIYLASPAILHYMPFKRYKYIVELPKYILWKCRLSFKKSPSEWVRTPRGNSP